ncbi:hypothetical protein LMG3458_03647 [Achromobacter deleyi]|uniref:Uncharacterized protein n=1 Tax=Achromobacter deleyi TaxID=1353891 RepID=A0A6S7BJQ5_9BURK|nr:hypothetical protein [Achromobacter deleyi]CAB3717329.1 hypothetical protein LMG3458_03647 [Achromobacter deleyi]CAB3845372.1 hypothetical protein LMG3481_01475 [Achromobacter deleyi]CAB3852439.1 hypothetical protein LMG3482_01838 [Achromobacter deleyi]
MAIDMEPKNGDFARYVENLSRAGGASPGRVPDKAETRRQASTPAATPSAPPSGSTKDSLYDLTWGKSAPPPLQSRRAEPAPLVGVPGQEDAATVSMAKRARQRKLGIFLTIAGAIAGWAAVNIAFKALRSPHFDLDELMPAVFLAFFAFMLFKAASGARDPRKQPLGKLPPLKTTSYRKDG